MTTEGALAALHESRLCNDIISIMPIISHAQSKRKSSKRISVPAPLGEHPPSPIQLGPARSSSEGSTKLLTCRMRIQRPSSSSTEILKSSPERCILKCERVEADEGDEESNGRRDLVEAQFWLASGERAVPRAEGRMVAPVRVRVGDNGRFEGLSFRILHARLDP